MSERQVNEPKKRGRPRGSKTTSRKIVLVRPAACPTCGSTERTAYKTALQRPMCGRVGEQEYTHIVYRDCKCKKCGKPRREAHFENRGANARPFAKDRGAVGETKGQTKIAAGPRESAAADPGSVTDQVGEA